MVETKRVIFTGTKSDEIAHNQLPHSPVIGFLHNEGGKYMMVKLGNKKLSLVGLGSVFNNETPNIWEGVFHNTVTDICEFYKDDFSIYQFECISDLLTWALD